MESRDVNFPTVDITFVHCVKNFKIRLLKKSKCYFCVFIIIYFDIY